MFCGCFQEFTAFGDTPESIFDEICVQMDASGTGFDSPEIEDLEFYQVFPVVLRNTGYEFLCPKSGEVLE